MTSEHFGNPIIEQRKLLAGEAAVEFTDRGILKISGPDAKSWLHSLVSQNIQSLNEGDSTESLLLDPQGRIEQQLKIVFYNHSLWLIVPIEKLEALISWLRKMVFRAKVELSDVSETFKVIGSFISLGEQPEWIDPWSKGSSGGYRYGASRNFPYRETLVPKDYVCSLAKAGSLAYQAIRIMAGRPEIADVDEKSLPHEFDWLASAVHLSKGCYRGQETVAKVHNLGHPPRRLVLLHLDSSEMLPKPKARVFLSGVEKGFICQSANHFEAGAIALALVSRMLPEQAELDVEMDDSSIRATQEILVPASAGATAPRPNLPKLKLGSR